MTKGDEDISATAACNNANPAGNDPRISDLAGLMKFVIRYARFEYLDPRPGPTLGPVRSTLGPVRSTLGPIRSTLGPIRSTLGR